MQIVNPLVAAEPKPSAEQEAACASKAPTVKILAVAGAGKSFTLKTIARRRPLDRFLYVAFNNPIAAEARRNFPKNTTCLTTHGLAWPTVGLAYHHAGLIGEPKLNQVSNFLKCSILQALCIRAATFSYLSSGDDQINSSHINNMLAGKAGAKTSGDMGWIIEKAWKLWDAMCDPTISSIPMTHDGYLKLYILNNPDLSKDYDGILLDEAQDSSGAIAKFLIEQKCQRALVGDPHQSINSWRGAINAMEKYKCEENFNLTTSYRYGSEVADAANKILAWKGETIRITGAGLNAGRIGTPAVLCRTNAAVLASSFTLASYGKSVHLIGGADSYRFKKIEDAYHLAHGSRSNITDPFYSSFESFDSLDNYGIEAKDPEIIQVCSLVKKHGVKILKMVQKAIDNSVKSIDDADIILSTVHRVKGMEFGTVALEEDFINMDSITPKSTENIEEVNLIYVGFTRAKSKLYPSKKMTKWLDHAS